MAQVNFERGNFENLPFGQSIDSNVFYKTIDTNHLFCGSSSLSVNSLVSLNSNRLSLSLEDNFAYGSIDLHLQDKKIIKRVVMSESTYLTNGNSNWYYGSCSNEFFNSNNDYPYYCENLNVSPAIASNESYYQLLKVEDFPPEYHLMQMFTPTDIYKLKNHPPQIILHFLIDCVIDGECYRSTEVTVPILNYNIVSNMNNQNKVSFFSNQFLLSPVQTYPFCLELCYDSQWLIIKKIHNLYRECYTNETNSTGTQNTDVFTLSGNEMRIQLI